MGNAASSPARGKLRARAKVVPGFSPSWSTFVARHPGGTAHIQIRVPLRAEARDYFDYSFTPIFLKASRMSFSSAAASRPSRRMLSFSMPNSSDLFAIGCGKLFGKV